MYVFFSLHVRHFKSTLPSACQILCHCVKIIGKVFSVSHNEIDSHILVSTVLSKVLTPKSLYSVRTYHIQLDGQIL
jgi:hypothetical protein